MWPPAALEPGAEKGSTRSPPGKKGGDGFNTPHPPPPLTYLGGGESKTGLAACKQQGKGGQFCTVSKEAALSLPLHLDVGGLAAGLFADLGLPAAF